jgi:hypothetical protein
MPSSSDATAPLLRSLKRLASECAIADASARLEAERCATLLDGAVRTASEGELIGLALHVQSVASRTRQRAAHQAYLANKEYAAKIATLRGVHESQALVAHYLATCGATEHAAALLHERAAHILANVREARERPVSLLAHARSADGCERLEARLAQYGKTTRFNHLPYVAVQCPAYIARELVAARGAFSADGAQPPTYARIYAVQPLPARKVCARDDWNLTLIGAQDAWERGRGENSVVAVIDTGIDYEHPDLHERFALGYGVDFVDGGEPMDLNGHGTHVAGTVAGTTTGVAPKATLYAVRVLNEHGFGSEVDVLRGIEWAIDNDVDVINMSLGSGMRSNAEERLVALAAKKGIAVACAAGNDGDTSYGYPASYDGAISVAAVDHVKKHARFSNRNDALDLSAPGVAIYSTQPGGGYQYLSGTSMATPHVAGACALLDTAGKEERLKQTAEALGESTTFGAGLIQLHEACK